MNIEKIRENIKKESEKKKEKIKLKAELKEKELLESQKEFNKSCDIAIKILGG